MAKGNRKVLKHHWIEDEKLGLKIAEAKDYCGNERPARKVFCQLKKGHKESCRALIFWEKKNNEVKGRN